jgi:excisionase family DNA binding protein
MQAAQNLEFRYLSRRETARMLNISLVTLWKLCKSGSIPSLRVGNRVVFNPNAVREAIENKKEPAQSR